MFGKAATPILLFALVLAGCAAPAAVDVKSASKAVDTATSVLSGAIEPTDLVAPTFKLIGALGKGGPAYGDGEPSIASSLEGKLYASFPGCDKDATPGFILPVKSNCDIGPVFRSEDGGATWKRLNQDAGAKLAKDGAAANGDADVAVDAAGAVYTSNLGRGIEVQRSPDGGDTWVNVGNIVPVKDRSVDRNWQAAAEAGHVIFNWMGGPENKTRQVGIVTTFDGGLTFTNVTYVGKAIGWEGSVQFAPDGMTAYVPYTEPVGAKDPVLGAFADTYSLWIARTLDGGHTWSSIDTGVLVKSAKTGMHFSGLMMAPALGVTGDGHVVYAYSEETPDPAGLTNTRGVVKFIASGDEGATWSKPVVVSQRANGIMPWVAPGAGDRLAITWFGTDVPGDPDRVGVWDLMASVVDGAGASDAKMVHTIIQKQVHEGGICTRGGVCRLSGSDRALLDYFESAVMPDGRIAIVYPADPLAGGKYIEIRIAIQDGGTPLLTHAN